MGFPTSRLRRMRRTRGMRELVREVRLSPGDLIAPVFVQEGLAARAGIGSMPGLERLPLEDLAGEVGSVLDLGIPAVMLFGIPASKDGAGSSASDGGGIVQRAIARIREAFGDRVVVMADVCLCQYTPAGHCGIVDEGTGAVDNDASNDALARIAVSQARAGADVVAPSAMMDGQVASIRRALDRGGFADVAIMPHSAKHRSAFYSPFRDAAGCAPRFGDRKAYQVPFTNARESMREVQADVDEGADIVMIKPALAYLDVISEARRRFDVPVAAYSVSGEYALVAGAAGNGWVDEGEVAQEILHSIKRAGADMIVTYFAKSAAGFLNGRGA